MSPRVIYTLSLIQKNTKSDKKGYWYLKIFYVRNNFQMRKPNIFGWFSHEKPLKETLKHSI